MILFLVIVRPYKSKYLFVINLISQTCMIFCTCAVVVLAYYDYAGIEDQDSRFLIGKIFVFGTLVLIYMMTLILIGHSMITAFKLMKFIGLFIRQKLNKNIVVPVIPLGRSAIPEN